MEGSVPRPADRRQRKYGTWASPISARTVAEQGLRLGFVALDGDDVYWLEGRPAQGGRNVLVRRGPDGALSMSRRPITTSARVCMSTAAAPSWCRDSVVCYSNFTDQRMYRSRRCGLPSRSRRPARGSYADATIDRRRHRLICVREDHTVAGREAVTQLVAISLDDELPSASRRCRLSLRPATTSTRRRA